MTRTIKIWFLLKKLQKACHEEEVRHPGHGEETGHSFRACVSEQNFLNKTSKGNYQKRAVYADFLALAENKMKFLDIKEVTETCKDCGKEKIPVKMIRLNNDGLEFVGLFDLIEYILIKYKLTWTLVLLPIITLIIGINGRSILHFLGL